MDSNVISAISNWFQSAMEKMSSWFSSKLLHPLLAMSCAHRFVSICIGFWFGIFPIPGLCTPMLLCAVYSMNKIVTPEFSISEMTVATAINLIATPICFGLLPFWINIGRLIFSISSPCDASGLLYDFKNSGVIETISNYSICLAVAFASWLIVCPFVMTLLIYIRINAAPKNNHFYSGKESPPPVRSRA